MENGFSGQAQQLLKIQSGKCASDSENHPATFRRFSGAGIAGGGIHTENRVSLLRVIFSRPRIAELNQKWQDATPRFCKYFW